MEISESFGFEKQHGFRFVTPFADQMQQQVRVLAQRQNAAMAEPLQQLRSIVAARVQMDDLARTWAKACAPSHVEVMQSFASAATEAGRAALKGMAFTPDTMSFVRRMADDAATASAAAQRQALPAMLSGSMDFGFAERLQGLAGTLSIQRAFRVVEADVRALAATASVDALAALTASTKFAERMQELAGTPSMQRAFRVVEADARALAAAATVDALTALTSPRFTDSLTAVRGGTETAVEQRPVPVVRPAGRPDFISDDQAQRLAVAVIQCWLVLVLWMYAEALSEKSLGVGDYIAIAQLAGIGPIRAGWVAAAMRRGFAGKQGG